MGCCGTDEPFIELVEWQERLLWRKQIFKRIVREEERGSAEKKGKGVSGLRISPLLPKPSLHFCKLLVGVISSLDLSQALTSRS